MRLEFYIEKYIPELRNLALNRMEKAGNVIRDEARAIVNSHGTTKRTQHRWREHGPYRTGKDAGKDWTARHYFDMEKTVRTVRKNQNYGTNWGVNNVRIYAGNREIWYAKQMEYGRGGWRGGRRSFLRPAIRRSAAKVKQVIENG